MSIDLKTYGQTEFGGTIVTIYIKTLREYLKTKAKPLTEDQIAQWPDKYNTLDKQHMIVIAEVNGSPVDAWFKIPMAMGYAKSNLKSFIDRNSLPLVELPKQVKQWLGKKVKAKVDKNGFLRLTV